MMLLLIQYDYDDKKQRKFYEKTTQKANDMGLSWSVSDINEGNKPREDERAIWE